METEAAFNDATGIAIFTIVITSFSVSQLSLFRAATSFATILGGGVLVGLAVALGAHFLSRIVTDPMSETMITITAVYGSLTVVEGVGGSGVGAGGGGGG